MEKDTIDYDFWDVKKLVPKKVKVTDASKEIEKLLGELSKLLYVPKPKKKDKKQHLSGRLSNINTQRCIVKMTYGTTKEAHINFLRSYMIQADKDEVIEKPKYFDQNYDEVPDYEIDAYESIATPLYFKFILSPENSKVPLKVLAREFIKNLQIQTGYSFNWKGVEHWNTNNPHVHILINGKDRRNGKQIKRISPRIIRNAHLSAEQICTNLIGPVSREELEIRRNKTFSARRWTDIDNKLQKHLQNFKYFSENKIEYSCKIATDDLVLKKRLDYLVDMGLAISFLRNNPPEYYLENDWDKKLKSIGRYNSFLDARSNLLFSTPSILEQYTPMVGKVQGFVSKIYSMNDEDIWTNAIVIENAKTNKAYYIPLKNPVSESIMHKCVTVECKKNQSGKLSPRITVLDDFHELTNHQKFINRTK